ncbi:5-hydroxytryptamine receptor-like [Mizuhopecten yessoensis]|uniref:5-hydroxytryptamine receptor n=1 Tax=Mizuhopecten yessoensis TaxID=6573 RepID=A0A210PSA3_MIZYE|nr:5-hydroxytryptamine receptor-like [Mizuhopecten yessoensis]XP_021376349.1 5-hydroxytryptamine receptor-like [Mizuhopecten yessoensis]XP_021376350.1 5-hydroxytryptamine receptor-like [Mizuhopecten yessoensis]XP_021376351.1 5-hydroxytryptamine receptor-like [Mizuhopecten yessoensis]XP_021376353.1 5-hydroxytryptamine receptor-like [Mizuhopecten yessoensis]OWF39387.1 5-hydroxytryptamine receptor [Mizuhopecten yessoensis]
MLIMGLMQQNGANASILGLFNSDTYSSVTLSTVSTQNETTASSVFNSTTYNPLGGTNGTTGFQGFGPQIRSLEHLITTSIILGLMILATIIGNVFVIAAIILEKNLHNVANYLILSLAVADLMVATLVMPISVVNEISTVWFLRPEICDMWISFDVLCCTASILHLVAISVDRYWAVTNIDYVRNRSAKQILSMIALSWMVGMCISIPPLFGWKEPANSPVLTGTCLISQDIGYTVFSTFGAFYVPTLIMMIIYAKIFQVARRRIRRKNFHKKSLKKAEAKIKSDHSSKSKLLFNSPKSNGHNSADNTEITVNETSCNGNENYNDKNENSKVDTNGFDDAKTAMIPKAVNKEQDKAKKQKEKLEMKRERKAARTLGIITGAFIICWLPFFIIALTAPLVGKAAEEIPEELISFVLWLGYANSLLNPILYTIFSPDFRNAFQKILFGKYSKKYRR